MSVSMNVRQWLWCLHCERCFEVFLTKKIEEGLNVTELEMQLPVEGTGKELEGLHRYEDMAECPHEGCNGNPMDFWSWNQYRGVNPDSPEVPAVDTVYPLYPKKDE